MNDAADTNPEETPVTPEQPTDLSPQGISAMQGKDNIPVSPSIPSPEQETAAPSEWKDLGIVNVPIADLPDPEDVTGPDDFNHHITWEDAKSATLQLPQIQKEVAAGKTGDDFSAEDEAAGLDWQNGRRRVYDLYYSNTNPIRVDKVGDQYSINSGRHRIFAAKELGLTTIPARVMEKQG